MTSRLDLATVTCGLALSAVPSVPTMPDPPSIAGANSDGGNAIYAKTFATGDGAQVIHKLNDHATRTDAAAEVAAGMPGVLRGLQITVAGLTATIAPGLAIAGGLVESIGGTKTLAASMTTYLWLTAGGTIAAATTTAIPGGAMVYLGAAIAGGSAATVDYSGRVELPGGLPLRRSADSGVPPNATGLPAHVLIGPVASYLWNGAAWSRLVPASEARPGAAMASTATASVTVPDGVGLLLVNAASGPVIVTVPVSRPTGLPLNVKRIDAGSNAVTVRPDAGTIDGVANVPISSQYDSLSLVADGANLWIV